MAQDFNVGADNQQVDKQRLEALKKKAKDAGEVFPYDTISVFATQKAVDAKHLPEIQSVGHELKNVHVNIADKLEAKGLFTKTKPEGKASKASELTAPELIEKINGAKSADAAQKLVSADETRKTVLDALDKKLASFA
jgi:hypothetical protein